MDDIRSALMQMLSGRPGGDSSVQLQKALLARINQRPPGDPLRDILAAMLAQRQPEAQKPEADPRVLLRAARDTLTVLQRRDVAIAAALGGCAECWGEQADCPQCKGLGRPGWATPDQAAFATWVSPALRAMAQAGSTPIDQGKNGPPSDAHNIHEDPHNIHEGATVS